MSEVENLTNDELRIELLKYGFANMPVTSTTRKVLMKKLKVAKEMQKSKTRRETVAVMKASDDEEPAELARGKKEKTPNRRATVAIVEKTKKVPATTTTLNGTDSPPKSQSRRSSSRAAPAYDKPIVSSSALQEQSDDEVIEVMESPAAAARRSKSKTPTLAKSETVRTSTQYIRTVPIVREEELSTEEEDKIFEVEFQEPQPVLQNRRTTTLSYSNKPTRNLTPTVNVGRTVLSTSYNPSISYAKRENYEDNNDDDDDDDVLEAPYLSSFAKRLSTLRAEPLDDGIKKYQKDPVFVQPSTSFSSNYRYSSSQYSKPMVPQQKAGVGITLAKKFDQMDRKYKIRNYVLFCMAVMIAVAIYVIFFT